MKKLLAASLALLAFAAGPAAFARPMTATDLATMRRIGAPAASPDGRWIAYQLRETDLEANRGRTDLWLLDMSAPGGRAVKIASSADHNEHDPHFSPDGRWLYYMTDASGSDQLWRIAIGGQGADGQPQQVTRFSVDLGGYLLAPTGDRVAVWADRDLRCADIECGNVPPPATAGQGSGRTYDQLFVRHWDTWVTPGVRSRIFIVPLGDGRAQGAGTPVATNLTGDAPSKPFGGAEELAWSPDGRTLYFALREAGRIEASSTNLDIFAASVDGGAPANLTAANQATDTLPAVSPDGHWLAWGAMARPGYESDRVVIHLRNLQTGETRALTQGWDRSVASIAWASDSRSLLVTAGEVLDEPLFRIDIATGRATRLTEGGTVGNVVPLADGSVVYTLNSLTAPDDLYHLAPDGRVTQLTRVNADKLADLDPVHVQRFHFRGANGDTVWGQIVKPANPAGRLPVALLIHGGPQGSFGNGWSYRWNPWLFSAPGYAAVTVDFHGSTGYGQAFTDAINRDWGGKPLQDLRLGLAAAGREDGGIDIHNACALGGSYGGYMVNWIAGQWNDGFRCLVTHDGVFDTRAMSFETEELWFNDHEFGGAYTNPQAAATMERWNPARFTQNWRTPTLVIHSERDFRIPYSQGLGVFTALQRRDIPSRLLVFPDENHWVLKPRNSIQWYAEVQGWMARWLHRGPGDAPLTAR
ncbi:S9 family peptidase [Sphingosinicella ginsenosidimutans]|uniref:S9 family peptidase n=1 Tax=Allosphingosinicella ginsenosidimutans TaxID=1176539 RepID=A0A5C6TVK2_9SPHN|nr:S9 family peptidase [Sphingosinicella ginsenosidimutans]TXC64266.1 S9 family peptidase [Sphingosinicella ginsenosidimutans]